MKCACRAIIMSGPFALAGCSEAPMTFMRSAGPAADPITRLGWGFTFVCCVVIVIIGIMVLWSAWRGAAPSSSAAGYEAPVVGRRNSQEGLSWIYFGVGISTVVLIGLIIWTSVTLSAVANPAGEAALTIEVRAHQWWWEARYVGQPTSRTFTTANELHIPAGKPVRIQLTGDDVIHSFWVPALAGKTDVIPGQTNFAWLQADRVGVYRGQCTEYCGQQHAQMALYVIADTPDAFTAWWQNQLAAGAAPQTEQESSGRSVFVSRCGSCHSIRGTGTGGILGPDLSHLMTRRTIAAGVLPNTAGNLAGWIADPQSIKPGSRMPTLAISGPELSSLTAYLRTLN